MDHPALPVGIADEELLRGILVDQHQTCRVGLFPRWLGALSEADVRSSSPVPDGPQSP